MNGVTWIQVGTSQTISMTTSATIGLAVTSHADGTLCTSTMDNVTVGAQVKSAQIASDAFSVSNSLEEGIRLFPNPASGILNIDFSSAEVSREISVFNTVGQLIHTVQTKNSSAQMFNRLN